MENEKKNKRKALILTIIAVLTLLALVGGATYAYFQAQVGEGKQADVNVKTGTTDSLTFSVSDIEVTTEQTADDNEETQIVIDANQENFKSGDLNRGDGVKATAHLIANDATNSASKTYNVYLNLKNEGEKGLVYTQGESQPELIMQIIGPDSQVYKETIDGLEYKEEISDLKDNTYSGYDITKASGLYTIAKNYNITAEAEAPTAEETQEWQIKIILLNLDANQNDNTGKEVTGEVLIQQEVIPTSLADVCSSEEKVGDCIKELYEQSNYKISNIVYHNAIAALEKEIPNNAKVAGDDSYRFVGANPNNYVCFGSACSNEATSLNYKNLYRIIGLFKNDSDQYEMKIIKADAATKEDLGDTLDPEGSAYSSDAIPNLRFYKGRLTEYANYRWNSTNGTSSGDNNVNMWKNSNLNTENLNKKYYNAIEEPYKTMVVEHEWQVGGTANYQDVKEVYESELGFEKLTETSNNCYTQGNTSDARECNETNDLTYSGDNAHVGLMYLSDYMYGTLPEYWTEIAENYQNDEIKTNNWLYLGIYEWTISRYSAYFDRSRRVDYTGFVNHNTYIYDDIGVRPVVYLTSDVKISGGSGTDADPFTLAM